MNIFEKDFTITVNLVLNIRNFNLIINNKIFLLFYSFEKAL
jgi:hypothetical protein